MRILHLEVENFRSISGVSLNFSPGLNVLYGPNDLGKSTLAESIRAALLVPVGTTAASSYVRWGSSEPARVSLTFESGGSLWRVVKIFGKRAQATLEYSTDIQSPRFRKKIDGRGVDGELRDLLSWGIPAPGGKGASKPTSFLVTTLLGRQGEVQGIFDATLAEDKVSTGRDKVSQAVGSLSRDPIVVRVLEQLSNRVDAVFTPTERFKQTADSPLVKKQAELKKEEDRLHKLREDRQRGAEIEDLVLRRQQEREELRLQEEEALIAFNLAQDAAKRDLRRGEIQEIIEACQRDLAAADELGSQLSMLKKKLEDAKAERERLAGIEATVRLELEQTQRLIAAASEEIVRAKTNLEQGGRVAAAERERRRAELESEKASLAGRLKRVDAAEKAGADQSARQRALQSAKDNLKREAAGVDTAKHRLDRAMLSAKMAELQEKQEVATRLEAALLEAQQNEAVALEELKRAERTRDEIVGTRQAGEVVGGSPELTEAEAALRLMRSAETRLKGRTIEKQIQELQAHEARALELSESAFRKRSQAASLEDALAGRILPTREQVASWRALEAEVGKRGDLPSSSSRRPVGAVIIGLAVGILGALALGVTTPLSNLIVIPVGAGLGALAGLAVWALSRGRRVALEVERERRQRTSERWTQEVLPSLRAAGLPDLAAYESAVEDTEQRRLEAKRLRLEAERDDLEAAAARQAAGPLESRRAQLSTLQLPSSEDVAAVDALLVELGDNASALDLRIEEQQRQIERLRRAAREADEQILWDVSAAISVAKLKYERLLKESASVKAEAELARQQIGDAEIHRLQSLLLDLEMPGEPALSIEEAESGLLLAKQASEEAGRQVALLEGHLQAAKQEVGTLLAEVGGNPVEVRQAIEAQMEAIEEELTSFDAVTEESAGEAKAVEEATRKKEELETQAEAQRVTLGERTADVLQADDIQQRLMTEIASREGELRSTDRPAIEARLQIALADPVLAHSEAEAPSVEASNQALQAIRKRITECDRSLNEAKGQLHLVAGHVGVERLQLQKELVEGRVSEVAEREKEERAALFLLKEITSAEEERSHHLGRTLAGPITDAFRALTSGRYESLAIESDLNTRAVGVMGEEREYTDLSVGTREQLATLMRLTIAAQLQTCVVLDDQLVHSDSHKLEWFARHLRVSAREKEHQIIVFTCRPRDYLPGAEEDDESVLFVDLGSQLKAG